MPSTDDLRVGGRAGCSYGPDKPVTAPSASLLQTSGNGQRDGIHTLTGRLAFARGPPYGPGKPAPPPSENPPQSSYEARHTRSQRDAESPIKVSERSSGLDRIDPSPQRDLEQADVRRKLWSEEPIEARIHTTEPTSFGDDPHSQFKDPHPEAPSRQDIKSLMRRSSDGVMMLSNQQGYDRCTPRCSSGPKIWTPQAPEEFLNIHRDSFDRVRAGSRDGERERQTRKLDHPPDLEDRYGHVIEYERGSRYRAPPQQRYRSRSPSRHLKVWDERHYRDQSLRRRHETLRPLHTDESSEDRHRRYYGRRRSIDRYRSRSLRRSDRFNGTENSRSRRVSTNHRDEPRRKISIPTTAYPLRSYSNKVAALYARTRQGTVALKKLQCFKNGDGKVNPSGYGSTREHDLGLCYTTFRTKFACEIGEECPWRHHPLTAVERNWILHVAGEHGRDILSSIKAMWASPDIPEPGANLLGAMKQERLWRSSNEEC